MAELDLTNIAASSINTPAAGVTAVFVDSADKRIKVKDENGVISTLTPDGLGGRNVLVNGGFNVQQRVATTSTAIPSISTTTRAGQVADRWAVTVGNTTTCSWAQIDSSAANETNLLARYYGKITQATNAAKFILSQFIINADMMHLRGQKVRVSCKIKQFVGSNQIYKLGLLQLAAAGTVDTSPAFISAIGASTVDPTWGTNLLLINPDSTPTGENGTISGSSLQITSTVNWVRSSCVFTIPADAKNLIVVLWKDSTGGATDATGIAEFQLTQGTELVDYIEPPLVKTILKCQRFYCKTFAMTTVPVTNAGINTGEAKGVAGKAGAVANSGIIFWRYPVVMWKTPITVTLYNPAAANALIRNITGTADMGATAATAQLDASTIVIATGVAATAIGDQIGIHITADAEIVA